LLYVFCVIKYPVISAIKNNTTTPLSIGTPTGGGAGGGGGGTAASICTELKAETIRKKIWAKLFFMLFYVFLTIDFTKI
jgi:hypothetical protein